MGYYPKISGNTDSRLDKKTGVMDASFDVYVYQNSGANDNAERANMIVCIVNNAIEGSGPDADLGIDEIQIYNPSFYGGIVQNVLEGTINTNADSGWILDPVVSGITYIGAPEGQNNIAQSSSGETWKTAGEASLCNAFVTHPGDSFVDTSANNLGTTPANYNIVPLYLAHNLVQKDVNGDYEAPIPANSWASFVVAYQPSQIETLSGYKLKIFTNAGNFQLDLHGSSFNEVIMGANVGSISGSTFTPTGVTINDGGAWKIGNNSNGCYPRAKTPALLRSLIGDDVCLKLTDVSSNLGQVGWKWKLSSSGSSLTSIASSYPQEGNMASAVADSGNSSGYEWIEGGVSEWVAPENMEDMSDNNYRINGNTVIGMSTYSQYPLGKNFRLEDEDVVWHNGSYYSASGTVNYSKSDFFRARMFWLKYETNPTNYDNSAIYNELFTMSVSWGVYTKITTPTSRTQGDTELNVTTAQSFASHVHGAGYGHKSYRLLDWLSNGSEFDLTQQVTYNNWGNDAAYALESYDFAAEVGANTSGTPGGRFAIYSPAGHLGKNPYQWSSSDSAGSYSNTTFTAFSTNADTAHAWLKYNLIIRKRADLLYENTTWPCKFDRITTEYLWDFDKISYYSKDIDRCWDLEGDYPGLKSKLYWNYVVAPSISRISLIPKNTATIDKDQGSYIADGSQPDLFDKDFSAQIIPEPVSQWYQSPNEGYHAIDNDSSNWENNQFSGTNGKAHYDDSSRNAVVTVDRVAAWQDVNSKVNTSAGTHNPVYRGYVDSNNNRIHEFTPVNTIYKIETPALSPNDNNYYSFGSFRFFNHGDDVVYIHSMKIVKADNDDDIFEEDLFQNPTGDPTNPEELNVGYKPNDLSADDEKIHWHISEWGPHAENENADPWRTVGATAAGNSGLYTEKKFYTPHTSSTQNTPIGNYRQDTGSDARYCSPVRKWFDINANDSSPNSSNQTSSEGFDNLLFNDDDTQDNYGIVAPTFEQLGCPSNTDNFYNGTRFFETWNNEPTTGTGSQTQYNAPVGDSLFLIRFKLEPKGTVHDIGDYRAKLVVFTYTHEYANRKKVAANGTPTNSTHNFDNWEGSSPEINLKLEEHHFYFKASVVPAPILQVMDADDTIAFPDSTDVDFGSINVG